MPSWLTDNSVAVGVDPYVDADRQKRVFDLRFNKPGDVRYDRRCEKGKPFCYYVRYPNDAGVLPVQLLVQHVGGRKLQLRETDILLKLPKAGELAPVSVSELFSWEKFVANSGKIEQAGLGELLREVVGIEGIFNSPGGAGFVLLTAPIWLPLANAAKEAEKNAPEDRRKD